MAVADIVKPEPSAEERALYNYVVSLYQSAKKAKDPVVTKVERFDKLWRGEHWESVTMDTKQAAKTKAVSNFIFAIIETEVTWMTENRPNIIVIPMEATDTMAAKMMERVLLDYLWQELKIRAKVKRMIRSALIRGKGFLKVSWDSTARDGGQVAVDYVPWDEVYLDPQASTCEDARYIIHARVMAISEIVKRWPVTGWKVEADPGYSDGITEKEVYSADVDRPIIDSSASVELTPKSHRALVIECWLRDDTIEMRKEMGQDNTEIDVPYLKYPNGRLIIAANGVVLTDTPNPFDDGEFPFVDFSAYEDESSPWDMGEVEQLEPPQRVINMLESKFTDNARLMTNTVWIADKTSGLSKDDFTNAEGQVLFKSAKSDVHREPPPPLPQHYFELYLALQRNMETLSGIHDVTQGRRPAGITAATAISLLQEAGQARIRDKARNLEDTQKRLGKLIMSRVLQFYPPQRLIRLRGPEGSWVIQQWSTMKPQVGLDLWVESGSSLQMNEQQRYQMGLEMFQAGALDAQGLLEVTNFPGRDEIISRMKANQAIMAQQQGAGIPGAGIASGALPPMPPAPGMPIQGGV